jgi:Tol biopolymer transport system component
MSDSPQRDSDSPPNFSGDRLESWKEIAVYLKRDIKTVQRWEKREAMPVHRHLHDKIGSVFAFRTELDDWARNRRLPAREPSPAAAVASEESGPPQRDRVARWQWAFTAVLTALGIGLAVALTIHRDKPADNPLASAHFVQLTDFSGLEQSAAISPDGTLVAFLSDRGGQVDVWLTQVGSNDFHNLTRGAVHTLVNSSVRTLAFSPDGTLVTFWTSAGSPGDNSRIGIWAVPVYGGSPRVYLDGAAEYQWTRDGSRLVFHTPAPGDPMFVRSAQESSARQIFVARPGVHSHFPTWAPDGSFIYFVQGTPGERMDLWRLKPDAPAPERLTNHDAAVSYPVVLDARRLLYLSTDRDGSGPWIYALDPDTHVSRRVSAGIDRFTSLAASRNGRRLAATVATPKSTLWRVPVGGSPATMSDARAIALTTGNGSSPRLASNFLLYVSSTGEGDTIWKLQDDRVSQIWTSPETRVIGRPSLSRDERRIAFTTRGADGRTLLWVANADGTRTRSVALPFELDGAPAWTPDGRALTVAGLVDGIPRLFTQPADGGPVVPMLNEPSTDAVWSPDGSLLVFSGADVGTRFQIKGVDAQGHPRAMPPLTLSRGARHVAFLDGNRSLVFLRGDMGHRDVWTINLETGVERQLTQFGPAVNIRDFDITPDGRQLVIEQVQEHSDVVLIELNRR